MMDGIYYAKGAGFVHHHSGARLTRSMAMESLSRHLADSLKPFITQADREFANACVDQITEAMAASFQTSEAPLTETTKPKSRRGFASMTPERRREIAARGGAAVPSEKRSFARNTDLAASAGRTGGQNSRGGGKPARKAAGQ